LILFLTGGISLAQQALTGYCWRQSLEASCLFLFLSLLVDDVANSGRTLALRLGAHLTLRW